MPCFADQSTWLKRAEACKPALATVDRTPIAVVQPVRDPQAFQGWSMQIVEAFNALRNRLLERRDSFTLDFGANNAGHLHLSICRRVDYRARFPESAD